MLPPAFVHAAAPALGLLAADDIDGFHYMEDGAPGPTPGDVVYFSLAPGSPTLAAIPATAGDVLMKSPPGAPGLPVLFATGLSLGLAPGDNLDALSMHEEGEGVPVELSSFRIE